MENLKNIIDIIVASTTVFSLIVIWLTLREMRIQRHKTFEPYLLPLNLEVIFLCQYPKKLLPIYSYLNKEQIKNNEFKYNVSIQLKNIGQGIAKDILVSVEWQIKYKEYIETIISELKQQNIKIDFQLSEKSCWISPDESIGVFSGGNFPFHNESKSSYDYLLPIKDNNEEIKIEIPSYINLMIELSILLIECLPQNEKRKAFEKFKQSLQIKINLNYKDNLEKTFSSHYNLKIGKIGIEMEGEVSGKMYKLSIER